MGVKPFASKPLELARVSVLCIRILSLPIDVRRNVQSLNVNGYLRACFGQLI